MILKQLLERLEYEVVQGSDKIEITTLINDSDVYKRQDLRRLEVRHLKILPL